MPILIDELEFCNASPNTLKMNIPIVATDGTLSKPPILTLNALDLTDGADCITVTQQDVEHMLNYFNSL
jgi:hypothetical protein